MCVRFCLARKCHHVIFRLNFEIEWNQDKVIYNKRVQKKQINMMMTIVPKMENWLIVQSCVLGTAQRTTFSLHSMRRLNFVAIELYLS